MLDFSSRDSLTAHPLRSLDYLQGWEQKNGLDGKRDALSACLKTRQMENACKVGWLYSDPALTAQGLMSLSCLGP